MFSRFLDFIRKGDDDNDEDKRKNSDSNPDQGNTGHKTDPKNNEKKGNGSDVSLSDSSSSTTTANEDGGKKRRVKEDYRIKYAYLDYVNSIDMRGLECMAEDVRSNLEILKNSYLAIVNSLVILDERRRKRQQGSEQALNNQSSGSGTVVQANSSNFINVKVAENFRNSGQEKLSSYPDTYEWTIDKFCDSATRDLEFQRLFQEAEKYIVNIDRIKKHLEPINMTRFAALVRQGKNLLGIIELLNNNYSNNFLDIFRIS